MKTLSLIIATACLVPILLIFGGWVLPLSEPTQDIWQHLLDTVFWDYFWGTAMLIIGVVLFAGMVGVATAWQVSIYDFPMRNVFVWVLLLPFAVPAYILAIAYGNLLEFAGPVQSGIRDLTGWGRGDYFFPKIRSLGGAVFVIGLASYAYVFLMARAAFATGAREWYLLASSLGKTRRQVFWQMAWPAARPFAFIGMALAAMEAGADIGVVQIFGVPSLASGIYRAIYYFDAPLITARLSSILVILAASVLLIEFFSRRRARFSDLRGNSYTLRQRIHGHRKWFAFLVCFMPVFLGFILPVFWLLIMAFYNPVGLNWIALGSAVSDSLVLALPSAALITAAGFMIALNERRGGMGANYNRLAASLGYAVPGLVIAVSLLMIEGMLGDRLGWRLVMTGSIFGLFFAFLIRFLSPAYQSLHAGFSRIPPQIDRVGQSFGKSHTEMVRKVYSPLLSTPALYAVLIVIIDVFKELPATLILRPFDIKPLSIAIYELADDDRPAEAAPFALILIVVSLIAVYLLARTQTTDQKNK